MRSTQIIPILKIMHSTQIIPTLKIIRLTQIIQILKIMRLDSKLTKLHPRFASTKSSDASRDQKELATEVTSKKLCRCVWLVTSVDEKMLGKIISPEQSKTKANGFVMRVANKKRRLHSGQQLSWFSRTG
jgi:hypothetical protein